MYIKEKKSRAILSAAEVLKSKLAQYTQAADKKDKNTYINHEFQDHGYRLALRLNDPKHKALYIRLAKTIPRALIEDAAVFADTYPQAQSKGKIFMWKLHQLMEEYKEKHPEFAIPRSPKSTGSKKIKKPQQNYSFSI